VYFDFDYYRRLLAHVWRQRGWPGRGRMLRRLLLWVPLESALHALFWLLDYVFFPRLWRQQVQQPVFIVGHARSGTTLAHRLLSADGDRFNEFLYWEMFFPSLLEKKLIRGLGVLDRLCLGGRVRGRLEKLDDELFGAFRHMHDMSFWNAEEDQFAMRAAFVTQQWSTDMPVMDIIDLFHLDRMPSKRGPWLRYYRGVVKRQLLLNGGQRIHLSKNPVMCGWVESLIGAFPDARFIVMVRNPLECMPSLLKLVELGWKGKGWQPADYANSMELLTQTSFESFTNPRAALGRHPETPHVFVDYRRLTSAPRETVHEIYQALGMTLSGEFDDFLAAQESREKSHQPGFDYSIDEFDTLSVERIETELGGVFDIYDWPRPGDKVDASTPGADGS
jgi:hypothetical protein